jgi:L-lactate dehydrogenase complex protein LldE
VTVALFAPCYVDQLYPGVAVATLRLLERLGLRVAVPDGAVCCGQPLANAGFGSASGPAEAAYQETFEPFDVVVTPSGSCAAHLRAHVPGAGGRTRELCEFLRDEVGVGAVAALGARWDARVGVHLGCHALRGLGLATPTEQGPTRGGPPGAVRDSAVHALLAAVEGLEVVDLARPDECCGFGGTFAVAEPDVSVKMGRDRLADHLAAGAEAVVSTDVSCAMHLEGIARRGGHALPFVHVAEALMMGVGEPAPA